jgi:hypothetical protein
MLIIIDNINYIYIKCIMYYMYKNNFDNSKFRYIILGVKINQKSDPY